MAKPCSRCGRTDLPLMLGEGGSICGVCESEAEDEERADRARWARAAIPPIALFSAGVGVMGSCFPVLGLFSAPLGAILSVAAIVAGVTNFLIQDAEGPQRTMLVLSGAVGLLGGLVLLPAALFGFITALQVL